MQFSKSKTQKEKIRMKNKKLLQVTSTLALLFPLALTACGKQDSQPLIAVEQATEAAVENAQTPAGTTSAQTDTDSPLAQRNTLEWEQRLDYTTERQAQLAEITVELAQDTEEVQQKAQSLLDAMAEENVESAVDSMLTEDWYTVMLSDLLIGQRNYTGTAETGDWKMTILSDELGQHCTAVEYPIADGRQFYVQATDAEIRYYVCAAEQTGDFISEILNLTDGSYVGYEGTLSAANRPEGKLTVHMGTADLSNGAAEAFHNRSAQAVTYEGDFTAEGKPATTTPSSLTGEGQVAYASRLEGKSTYYLTVAAEGADEAFAPEQLGICSIWN